MKLRKTTNGKKKKKGIATAFRGDQAHTENPNPWPDMKKKIKKLKHILNESSEHPYSG